MKKITLLFGALIILASGLSAKQVEQNAAQLVAENFIRENARLKELNITLFYTERSAAGDADYYVFDINNNSGFVIVCAEDGAHPIIGYSTEGPFVQPSAASNPNFNFWMEGRKSEIEYIRNNNIQPDAQILNEWSHYNVAKTTPPVVNTPPVSPLCAANWDQTGAYNDMCPGGSMTGCVATAMAIIMKKWAYPTTGTGQSSYTAGSYGTLSANYGATTYNWAAMTTPYCSGTNTAVATIMSHCGISVQMNYSPSGSGAMVCGNPGAEYSYKTYFGYNPTTLQCKMQASDPNWVTTLKNEFNLGRPMQYQGVDASQGGHTWVCDGYDASDKMHMNWGWSGSSNGYYAVTNLAPSGSGLNFTTQLGGLIGIQPAVLAAMDAGIPSITYPSGTACSTTFSPIVILKNFGTATLTSCTINYHIDSNPNQTYAWSGSLAQGASANVTLPSITTTSGSHTFTSSTSNPNGNSDGYTGNDQGTSSFNIATVAASLPLSEGFESVTAIPSGWSLYNPDNDCAWQVSTTVGKIGTHSIGFNNCDGDQSTDMTGRKDRVITTPYNFSTATSANMTFDVAYSMLYYQSVYYGDTLWVVASTDCGATWTKIYGKGGSVLATCPQQTAITSCWTPTANDWRNDNINLNSFCGQGSVMFAFENHSMWGEWIYIDDINITAVTGVADINAANSFSLYPNPAASSVTIEGTSTSETVHYSVCNMLGAEIQSGNINAGGSYNAKIAVGDLSTGMYFIKVTDGDSTFTKKLNKL